MEAALPAGTYIVAARTSNLLGAVETDFTTRAGNLRTITVP